MSLTRDEKSILNEIRTDQKETRIEMAEIRTVLLGKNSDKGLVGQVNSNSKRINKLWIAIFSVVGSGIVGGGILGAINGG